jgi:hypothetical protein
MSSRFSFDFFKRWSIENPVKVGQRGCRLLISVDGLVPTSWCQGSPRIDVVSLGFSVIT